MGNPSAEGPRDLCYMFHEFDDATSQRLLNIRGDDSVAAVKVQLEDGWACGYMKQPEQAFLNFKQYHGDVENFLLTDPMPVSLSSRDDAGGEDAEKNAYPWQVGIVKTGKGPICGGVLVSNQHILTSVYCVDDAIVSSISVIVGEHNIDDDEFVRLPLSKIVIHPDWNREMATNAIAILTLAEPLSFSAEVSSVCLPWHTSKEYTGEVA